MNSGFKALLALVFLLCTSLNAVATTKPPPAPPVLRLPPLNLGCAPGMMAECGCSYFTCKGPNGGSAGGYPEPMRLCGDVNGSGGSHANLQDCIDATNQICQMQGYSGVYSYDCYDYSESGSIVGEPVLY